MLIVQPKICKQIENDCHKLIQAGGEGEGD